MGIAFDYRPAESSSPAQRTLAVLEPLQAYLQKALGHELPNRLMAIQGWARLLLREKADRLDDEGKLYLDRLATGVRQADEMVRGLADLDRLLLDPGEVHPLDLVEVAQEAGAEVKVLCPGRDIEYDWIRPLPELHGARRPWHHLLVLLFRFLVERSGRDAKCRIVVRGQAPAAGVEVRIEAPGLVLAEEELAGLFKPFARGGSGLELFPVRLLVASWAGRLQLDSLAASGTCFLIQVRGAT